MKKENSFSREKLKQIILIAVFTALSYGCLVLIRVPGIAGFLTLDVKDAVVTLGAMFLGPISALLISLLVSFIEMITVSGTGFWGFLMNFLGTAVFAAMASFVYKRRKTLWGGIVGLFFGVIVMVAVMRVANIVVTPIYQGYPRSAVIDLLPTLFVFNLMKGILNAAVVLFLYKPVSNALKAARFVDRRENERLVIDVKTMLIMALALAIAAASVAVLLLCL